MSDFDLLLLDAHVATMETGYGAIRDAAVGIRGDRIAWVGPRRDLRRDRVAKHVADPGVLIGLAGIDEARFHRPVRPGDRLIMVGHGLKIHRRLSRFRVVGTVGGEKAFEVVVGGVTLGQLRELRGA